MNVTFYKSLNRVQPCDKDCLLTSQDLKFNLIQFQLNLVILYFQLIYSIYGLSLDWKFLHLFVCREEYISIVSILLCSALPTLRKESDKALTSGNKLECIQCSLHTLHLKSRQHNLQARNITAMRPCQGWKVSPQIEMLALLSTSVAILRGPLEVRGLMRSRGGTLWWEGS